MDYKGKKKDNRRKTHKQQKVKTKKKKKKKQTNFVQESSKWRNWNLSNEKQDHSWKKAKTLFLFSELVPGNSATEKTFFFSFLFLSQSTEKYRRKGELPNKQKMDILQDMKKKKQKKRVLLCCW